MSFGFSVSDFVTVGGLCWKLYKKCKDSPGNYKQLTSEVGALHNVIKETEELLSQQNLTEQQKEKLRVATAGCEEVLQDLDELLARYGSIGTKSQRICDRLGFGTEDIDTIRTRLTSNVTLLDAFNNASSNARLEEKLNILIAEVRSGKRESSVISIETVDSITRNNQEAWDAFRKELEDVGISSSVIAEKRDFLIVWFQEAVAAGKLEEDVPEEELGEDSDDPLEQSTSGQRCEGRRANHEPYASNSTRKHVSGPRQIDRSVLLTQQRSPIDSTGSDGTPIDLGGLTIAELKEYCQMEPLPPQFQSSTEDLNYHPKRDGMAPSGASQQMTSREVSDPHVHSNTTDSQPDRKLRQQKNKKSRLRVSYVLSRLRLSKEDLFEVVRSGDLTKVERALHQVSDVHVKEGVLNESPLHVATIEGMIEVVSLLLQHGHFVNCRDSRGYTPLHQAALNGRVQIVKLLLNNEAELEYVDRNFMRTPLHLASLGNDDKIVRLLLDHGAKVQAKDHVGYSPLHLAFDEWSDTLQTYKRARLATARVLLEKGADIDAVNKSGLTALHKAVSKGPQDTIQFLLERVNIQKKVYKKDQTPLHVAVRSGRRDVVLLLLAKGFDVNAKENVADLTPLHYAAREGLEGITKILLNKGAEVNVKDRFEQTPIHMAVEEGHEKTVEIVLAEGAEVNAKDNDGQTSLHKAALEGHEKITKILLDKGAEVNAKDSNGQISLHYAAEKGHEETVKTLLNREAEVNAKDSNGQTSLHIAAWNGQKEIVKILLARGADPDAKDLRGNTASDLATLRGSGHRVMALHLRGNTTSDLIRLLKRRHSIAMLLNTAPRST